jgi:SAM-dependent methyltransferase
MGLGVNAIRNIAALCRAHGIRGRAVSLGRQTVEIEPAAFYATFADITGKTPSGSRVVLDDPALRDLFERGQFLVGDLLSDHALFRMLGFDSIDSVDVSAYEGSSILFDLNDEGIENVVTKPYDFLVDSGTMEHVFHVPNVLRNMFMLVRPGGYIFQQTPCNGMVDHGFYQFCPTLFYDWFSDNKFDVIDIRVFQPLFTQINGHDNAPWSGIEYRPGCLDENIYDLNGTAIVQTIARKREDSTWHVRPQQRAYRQSSGWLPGHRGATT